MLEQEAAFQASSSRWRTASATSRPPRSPEVVHQPPLVRHKAGTSINGFYCSRLKRLNFTVNRGALSQSSHRVLSEPFQSFARLEGELSRMEAVNKSLEIFVLFISLSAIYGAGSSGSITMWICFQSSGGGPFLKSKIDMFSAAVPPALCFNSM